MRTLWAAGLLLEAALLGVMFTLLVRPDPPLVAQLRGEHSSTVRSVFVYSGIPSADTSIQSHSGIASPSAADSFYTILHWPLNKPLLEGGGRVVAVPMRLWWVPALYVGAVPLLLICVTGLWFSARYRAPRADPAP